MTTLTPTPLTISLNGSDNVGKTTQLAWLARGLPEAHHVGTIDRWHERWSEVGGPGFSSWWFEQSSTEEHTRLVIASHGSRRQGSSGLALEDRGLPMLMATCAATSSIKDGLEPLDALERVTSIAAAGGFNPDERRDVHILMCRRDDPRQEAEAAIARERGSVSDIYKAYQQALAAVISAQVERGAYDVVLRVGDAPILDVQRQLRIRLAEADVPVEILPESAIDRLWILGGMSESGKSTVGELLRDEHGVTRLKIGYLLEQAALRAGEADPYAWPAAAQATHLTEEVLRFAEANHARTISLESAHSLEQTQHLKATWGDRCQVVYLDAPMQTRAARTDESTTALMERDAIKSSRGADGIRTIADAVIDNSGQLSRLKLGLPCLTKSSSSTRTTDQPWAPVQDEEWLGVATNRLADDATALVLATGSTGKSHWIDGWSDVDLLVVRDKLSRTWLKDVTADLAREGYKVGLSAFTTAEVSARCVPARVIAALRTATDGTGILHRRMGYAMPEPALDELDRAGRADLGLILMNTRRLLAAPVPDVRALYKHLLLIARVLVQAEGVEPSTPDVIDAFSARHNDPAWNPPTIGAIVDSPHDPAVVAQLIDAVDHILQHVDILGRNIP